MASNRRIRKTRNIPVIRSPFGDTPPPLSLVSKPDRGKALITTVELKPGQVVLVESPFVIYPASLDTLPLFCSCCFRQLPPEPLPCSKCHVALFCSQRCQSLSHPSLLCHALPKLTTRKHHRSGNLMFLLSAYSLSSSDLILLLSLNSNSSLPGPSIEALHSQLTSLIPGDMNPLHLSPRTTSSLLSKEKNNSFPLPVGVAVPRAYGLYLWISMINHDCMPNVCLFSYVNDPELHKNTDFILRTMHTIEAGSELCISYVDILMVYTERQKKLLTSYQFKCKCSRCDIEKNNEEEGQEAHQEEEESDTSEGSDDSSMIVDYLETFVCVCGGLVAPLPPSQDGTISDLRECNYCGARCT